MSSHARLTHYQLAGRSILLDPKGVRLFIILISLICLVAILSLSLGSYYVSPQGVLSVFFSDSADSMDQFIVADLRLPRVIAGLAAGIGFGLSGATFQSLSHNPLASPDIIGVTAGASMGAVVSLILFDANGIGVALGAMTGIIITTLSIGFLSWNKHFDPNRFILVGIGVGLTLFAAIDYLLSRSDIMNAGDAYQWLLGSLNASNQNDLYLGLLSTPLLLLAAFWVSSRLDKLSLGIDIAQSHGIAVTKVRACAVIVALIATTIAVYISGPVSFIALAAGPITRQILGKGPAVFLSALMGGFLLLSADLLARMTFAPLELPVGLFTAILGGIFLIWMLIQQSNKGML
ncbi:hypothetical protein EOL70_16235 [Leucothrix sargassi]|nr:hypothetical protein EOL70_16235 [Leucothrix sargassi]